MSQLYQILDAVSDQQLARHAGPSAALLVCVLARLQNRAELSGQSSVRLSMRDLAESCGLSERTLRTARDRLVSLAVIRHQPASGSQTAGLWSVEHPDHWQLDRQEVPHGAAGFAAADRQALPQPQASSAAADRQVLPSQAAKSAAAGRAYKDGNREHQKNPSGGERERPPGGIHQDRIRGQDRSQLRLPGQHRASQHRASQPLHHPPAIRQPTRPADSLPDDLLPLADHCARFLTADASAWRHVLRQHGLAATTATLDRLPLAQRSARQTEQALLAARPHQPTSLGLRIHVA